MLVPPSGNQWSHQWCELGHAKNVLAVCQGVRHPEQWTSGGSGLDKGLKEIHKTLRSRIAPPLFATTYTRGHLFDCTLRPTDAASQRRALHYPIRIVLNNGDCVELLYIRSDSPAHRRREFHR